MDAVLDFLKSLIAKEPARFVAYASSAAVAGALWLADALGVDFSAELLAGIAAFTTIVVTELIRHLVFAPATVEKIAAVSAVTGDPAVGPPPSGEVEAEPPLAAPYAGEEEE